MKKEKVKKVQFGRRVCVTLDDDVIALANESAKVVTWDSQTHVVNAAMREALSKFAPHVPVTVKHFEQLVFFKGRKARTS